MPHSESNPSHDAFRKIEAEFSDRPDHKATETTPPLITTPTELEFQQLQTATAREERDKVENERLGVIWAERHALEKREKWKSRMKKGLAVAAIALTYKSGGLIDMAGDQFSDAGNVAADAIVEPQVEIPDEMDGIKFEDYSAEAQQEFISEQEERVETEERARSTVVDLFSLADKEGYDGIVNDVQEQRNMHPELFVGQERIEAAASQIDEASSNEDALRVLGEFMSFYSIEAGFDDASFDDKQSGVKDTLKAYINVFSALPKDFIGLADLKRVTVSGGAVTQSDMENGTEAGSYSPNNKAINIVVKGRVLSTLAPVEGLMQGDDFSYETAIAHELGHALDENVSGQVAASLPESERAEGVSVGAMLEQAGRNIIKRPDVPSAYSRTSSDEYQAELLSGVLSDRSNGLRSVNEWREFGSEANKQMVATLAMLESVYPGIAKILIANRVN